MPSIMDELYFPKAEVISQSTANLNLVPYLQRFSSNRDAEQALDMLRALNPTEAEAATRLGIAQDPITLYEVQFGKLRCIIPVTARVAGSGKNELQATGFIPLKPIDSVHGWRLGFKYQTDDEGGSQRRLDNFMETGPTNLVTRMRFSLTPYCFEGADFNPSRWTADFDILSAVMQDCTVEYYDRAKVHGSFSASNDKGLFLDSSSFSASFAREVLNPPTVYKFKLQPYNVIDSRRDESRNGLLQMRKGPKNPAFGADIMKRMQAQWLEPAIKEEDLIAATVFPAMSGNKRKIDANATLKAILKLMEAGSVDKFAGFNWVRFS